MNADKHLVFIGVYRRSSAAPCFFLTYSGSVHFCGKAPHCTTMALMKLTFWGAAGTVTGSMHLLESGGKRYLLDCGLFQGRRKDADLKNRKLPFPGDSIDAVVLSHAHIDH